MTDLVVTADDYGLTPATSRAILRAHRDGIVTATSVLAARVTDTDLTAAAAEPALGVGVHVAMVGEDPPLLSAREIPTLVDRHGRLAPSWRHLLPRLAARRIDPADVRAEAAAQLDRVAAGVTVGHLDTHQHLHLWPSIASVVVDLAVARSVPAIRVPHPTGTGPKGRAIAGLSRRLAATADAAGLRHPARFRGLDEAGGWTRDALVAALGALAVGSGTAEINVHPGPDHDPDRDRYRWNYGWGGELAALCDPAVAAAVAAGRFRLVTPDGTPRHPPAT